MNQKKDVAGPVCISLKPTMAKEVMAAAKQRGYKSRSAFLRDLIEKELGRNGGQQAAQKA